MKIKNLIPLLLCTFSHQALSAANFTTDFVELGIQTKPNGISLEGGRDINDSLALLGGVSSNADLDEDNYDVYIGPQVYGPINQAIDLNTQLLLHYNKGSYAPGKSKTFIEFNAGLRAWITQRVEANVMVGANGEHSIFTFGARFHATDKAAFSISSKSNGIYGPQLQLGVRYNFN
ncbi:hypothetical protein F0251_10815 [Vibrio sp. 070316B]|uniref:hypothetical protein n=1 Tax=Vibrio sp. 070316B TaxID=2607608 RepID=UPI0014935BA7|nr:hypothetical protein [Vibrio sp. 070316B]NOI38922.1 hypothetical protein [Vibrio sp. 070316B]